MSTPTCRYYFIDEAGDGNLFDRRGNIIVGQEGCSDYFMPGLLDVRYPARLAIQLDQLRAQLLSDPYLQKIPSMQERTRKTHLLFHAKDDCPEVRREVFHLLIKSNVRFFAVVRNKRRVLFDVHNRNENDPAYRYHPNELYDFMIRRLLHERLHKDDRYEILFSKRGKQDRTAAIFLAVEQTRQRFIARHHIQRVSPIHVEAKRSHDEACLQAVDYFLWALQRFYERREARYLDFLWPKVSLIRDLDQTKDHAYGEYFTQKRPLIRAAPDDSSPGI